MAKIIQISVDNDLDRAIRREAQRLRLTISSYTRQLLVQSLRSEGVQIDSQVPKEQLALPKMSEVEKN